MGSGEPSQNLKEDVEQSRQAEQLKLEPPNENSAVIPIVVTENQTTAIPVTNVLEASDNSRLSGNFPQQSVAPQGRRLSRFLPSASTQPEVEEHHPPKPEVAEHTEKEEVLDLELEALIQTAPSVGLTDSEASLRLEKFGPNEFVKEKRISPLKKFAGYFGGPISILLEIAAIISAIASDWADLTIILLVLIVNAIIGYREESKAENALDALKNTLALKSKAVRNGVLSEIEAVSLVPGDIIALRLGDIVPADCKLLGLGVTGDIVKAALHIDQSSLTGESLAVQKFKGNTAYSSSIVKQGQMMCVVTKTGSNTFLGRAAHLMSSTHEEGHFQKIINTIGNFLVCISVVMVVILLIVLSLTPDHETKQLPLFINVLKKVVVLAIAAIPLGLPTVMSVTLAVGANQLAAKKVILKRLPAIEELASVSILCSDKTGTLTLNELTFDKPYLANIGSVGDNMEGDDAGAYEVKDLLTMAYLATEPGAEDPVEKAVRFAAENSIAALKQRKKDDKAFPGYKVESFTPFNPHSKYTEATIRDLSTNETFRCVKGAPHVISKMCGHHKDGDQAVLDFSVKGLRALGVAMTVDPDMKFFNLIGMIALLDPPRVDSGVTVSACQDLGVKVKMITGDALIIAKEVASRLGISNSILDATMLEDTTIDEETLTECIIKADGFAQVIPEHKFKVVDLLQKRGYLVAMTGDGVNDAPALKKANVGIAVHGCTEAARSAADIILLAPGLGTIVDGITISRQIFQRMRSYSSILFADIVYRIASTIHFLLFFFIALLAFSDFEMSDKLVIMIAVLNDAATLVISIDSAKISKKPDKWRLGQLLTLSTALGLFLTGFSFITYFIAKGCGMTPKEIGTIMYLQISSCPHFVIFSTRVNGRFWESVPSISFFVAVLGTQVIAMFISVYGAPGLEAEPIGWVWGISIIATSLGCFVILDFVKVFILQAWSLELVAKIIPTKSHKSRVARRIEEADRLAKVVVNFDKVKRVKKTGPTEEQE